MRKEIEEDDTSQLVGKVQQRTFRTREVGEDEMTCWTAGMCFVMTAAAVLLEDLEEGLPHWERGKKKGKFMLHL